MYTFRFRNSDLIFFFLSRTRTLLEAIHNEIRSHDISVLSVVVKIPIRRCYNYLLVRIPIMSCVKYDGDPYAQCGYNSIVFFFIFYFRIRATIVLGRTEKNQKKIIPRPVRQLRASIKTSKNNQIFRIYR